MVVMHICFYLNEHDLCPSLYSCESCAPVQYLYTCEDCALVIIHLLVLVLSSCVPVSMWFWLMMLPPHKYDDPPWVAMTRVIQGYLLAGVSVPPTMRVSNSCPSFFMSKSLRAMMSSRWAALFTWGTFSIPHEQGEPVLLERHFVLVLLNLRYDSKHTKEMVSYLVVPL